MNHTERMKQINFVLQTIRQSNKVSSHLNCIRLNSSCSDKHNDEIIKRCKEYLKIGTPFLTECIFVNGQRADILLPSLNPPIIEEIACSESEESILKKRQSYPFKISVIRI